MVSRAARRALFAFFLIAALAFSTAGAASPGLSAIRTDELKEWLTYIASDELKGRGDYSAGLELAARYIEDHLRMWGVKPAGDANSYLQTVQVVTVRSTSQSTVTVQVAGQARTFKDGEGVNFPREAGGRRTVSLDHVEFVGYGLDIPGTNHLDLHGKDIKGAAIVWIGARGPKDSDGQVSQRLLPGRSRRAIEEWQAAAAIGEQGSRRGGASRSDRSRGADGQTDRGQPAQFTTSERLDKSVPPSLTADDGFFNFLFSRAPVPYDELKRRAAAQGALPSFRLNGVKITINVNVQYEIIRTQSLHNVVGIVEGTDPRLKSSYVAFGAHYDHLGSLEGDKTTNGTRQAPPFGRVTPGAENDRIWNGADDDGSGTVAVMALAKAFGGGPRPKRSLLFIWHAGEELGLYGSRYFVDHSTVPIDAVVAQLNIDMIGRNHDDSPTESNTVHLVGSDRISTELHELSREANRELARPMQLDYDLNDPSDPEEFYYRSDHHSYAAKGIPVIFFTTGLEPDYHTNTDEVSKILFDKMTHVVQLVYETGVRVANLDHPPVRDYKGARAGKDTK